MRPTGKLHLGNYMGALHNWVRLQHEYECFFFIADWHALTTDYANPADIPDNIGSMAVDWLSAGLDPEKCTLFVQSHVHQHADLHLALSMITPLSWLERVPSYKDQQLNLSEKDLSTYGFLGYPLLQSADILLYGVPGGSLHVPVGADQVAHVELTREVARRFNFLYPGNRANLLPARTLSQSQLIAREGTGIAGLMSPRGTGIVERDVRFLDIADGSPHKGETLLEPQVLLTPTPKLPGTDAAKCRRAMATSFSCPIRNR